MSEYGRHAKPPGHCSSLYAISPNGYKDSFAFGHNEDWSHIAKDLYYFVEYKALPNANFSSCSGFIYPGTLMGWAGSWNSHGMFLTQNSLFPSQTRKSGLSDVFVQREALCGASG